MWVLFRNCTVFSKTLLLFRKSHFFNKTQFFRETCLCFSRNLYLGYTVYLETFVQKFLINHFFENLTSENLELFFSKRYFVKSFFEKVRCTVIIENFQGIIISKNYLWTVLIENIHVNSIYREPHQGAFFRESY